MKENKVLSNKKIKMYEKRKKNACHSHLRALGVFRIQGRCWPKSLRSAQSHFRHPESRRKRPNDALVKTFYVYLTYPIIIIIL